MACGTCIGTGKMFEKMQTIFEASWAVGRYALIRVDIDLYVRYMKYVNSTYKIFPRLRKLAFVGFELWHVSKILYTKVFVRHFYTIIAPIQRALYPNQILKKNVTQKVRVAFLNDLACAYKSVRPRFLAVYRRFRSNAAGVFPTESKTVRQYEQFFEFLLPLVCKYPCASSRDDAYHFFENICMFCRLEIMELHCVQMMLTNGNALKTY